MSERPVVVVVTRASEWHAEQLAARLPEFAFVGASTFADAAPHLPDAEVLICGSALTAADVARMPKLRWVQAYISGTDEIGDALAARPDVLLTSARGLHARQMAEMALLHMLFLSRNVHAIVRNQSERVWEKVPQRVLERRVVGIVGLGGIGQAVARACTALEMTVYGFSRTDREVAGVARVFERSRLAELAPALDFLVLAVPYSADTDKLVDDRVLGALKQSAILVNLARGGVVDEAALVAALRERRIGGAGLDVFTTEPLPPESPLWQLDNVLITPHLAGQSDRYNEDLLPLFEHNLRAWLAGWHEKLRNVVPR